MFQVYPEDRGQNYSIKLANRLAEMIDVTPGGTRPEPAPAGAGLVTLAAPEAAFPIYAAALTGVIVHPLAHPEDFRALLADRRRNAALLGPGAGVGAETRDKVLAMLAAEKRAVLDADALTSFADDPQPLFSAISSRKVGVMAPIACCSCQWD